MDCNPLSFSSPSLEEIRNSLLSKQSVLIENISGGAKAFLSSWLFNKMDSHVLFISDNSNTDIFSEDVFGISGLHPEYFPPSERELSPELVNIDAVGQRDQLLHRLLTNPKQCFCITTLSALLEKTVSPESFRNQNLILKVGEESDPDTVSCLLSDLGYRETSVTTDKGEMSCRGGIIDIFPLAAHEPFRIEFWDDAVTSIRSYNPVDQLSTGKVDKITITPTDALSRSVNLKHSLLDYLSDKKLIVIFDNLSTLENKYAELAGTLNLVPGRFLRMQELIDNLSHHGAVFLSDSSLNQDNVSGSGKGKINLNVFLNTIPAIRIPSPFIATETLFLKEQRDFSLSSYMELIEDYKHSSSENINVFFYSKKKSSVVTEPTLQNNTPSHVTYHNIERDLSSGFYFVENSFFFVSTLEFSSQKFLKRSKQRTHVSSCIQETFVPLPGEIVVHIHNGIGKFKGIRKTVNPTTQIETEYLEIEYADNGTLCIPASQSHLIMKYVGPSEKIPPLNKLGSTKWKRSKDLTEQSLVEYARHLVRLEAERALRKAFVYPEHGHEVKVFCDSFPYEETVDQLQAIEDIFNDMYSEKVMDRLICGDAGFGKTEVAMRAIAKAVFDGRKQVAVMTPTTLLAVQHYETFLHRMADLPVNIAVLSRLSSTKEVKQTLQGIMDGTVDIVIGTHRIISKDVAFKNLGLLVIDEEQRFGVQVKEHLKQNFPEIDCLTLSATPIPRTLYMSLVGARDLSVIAVPPSDRLPVSSFVCEENPDIIKSALRHELMRDGQAYIIHNRIETIFEYAQSIQELVPEAKIVVAHGKMLSKETTPLFQKFKSKQADILVATSIIENGIDIPNANTIIVHNADHFGMADLYQMKGRVGRWNKKSYCYFLLSKKGLQATAASERLQTLTKHEYGGGMKVALRDLELRGAGNILGTDQSGHISAVGFNLYCKLLKRTIKSLETQRKVTLINEEIKIDFPVIAEIPDLYITDTSLRLEIYQKLGNTETNEELCKVVSEIQDRFGPIPDPVLWLIELNKLKFFATTNNFNLIKGDSKTLRIEQYHGKKELIKKSIPYTIPTSPQGFFDIMTEILKMNFPCLPN